MNKKETGELRRRITYDRNTITLTFNNTDTSSGQFTNALTGSPQNAASRELTYKWHDPLATADYAFEATGSSVRFRGWENTDGSSLASDDQLNGSPLVATKTKA